MPTPFTSQENIDTKPILIIDRGGFWGEFVASIIKDFAQVVQVTPEGNETQTNPLFVKFKENVPQIPSDSYSHILVFWDFHSLTKEILQASFIKATQDKAKVVVLFERNNFDLEAAQNIISQHGEVGVFGDVFGTNRADEKHAHLDTYIARAKHTKKISLPLSGMLPIRPVSFLDTMKLLLNMTFGESGERKETQLLYPPFALTELRFAHAIVRIDPEVGVAMGEGRDIPSEPNISGEYLLPGHYDPFAHFKETYDQTTAEEIKEIVKEEKDLQVPLPIKQTVSVFAWLLRGVITIGVLLLFVPLVSGGIGTGMVRQIVSDVSHGDINGARQISSHLQSVGSVFERTNTPLIGIEDSVFPSSLQNIITSAPSLISDVMMITDQMGTQSKKISGEAFISLQAPLVDIVRTGIMVEGGSLDTFHITSRDISTVMTCERVSRELLGIGSAKKYLVLLQNDAELRPGGGFIGSYGEMTVTNGEMNDFSVKDVYDADGQLKGHREPPFFLRRYLPQVHLYLRDSNTSPDFPTNALLAQRFLKEEMNTDYDGVIGVDLFFVRELLRATGPLYVPDYSETVTADTFFDLAEKHAEKNFFAGSTAKKDYLKSVVSVISNHITEKGITLPVVRSILTSLYEKHITISVNDPSVENVLVSNGLAGSIWDGRIIGSQIINDFLLVSEANVGVNKANAFVTRSLSQGVTVDTSGGIQETVSLTLYNASQKGVWPGGVYKNYLRFFVPQGSALKGVLIDGVVQKTIPAITDPTVYERPNFTLAPDSLEIETATDSGHTYFGMLIQVPEQIQKKITIAYTLPGSINMNAPLSHYSLRVVRQSGIDTFPYSLSVTTPSSLQVTQTDGANQGSGNVNINQNITEDTTLNFSVVKR